MSYDDAGNAYKGTIPSQSADTTVIFKVYAKDNAGNWTVSELYKIMFLEAPVEIDNPPTIDGISWSPEQPTEGEDVYIFCQVSDDNSVSLVVLSYYNGTWYNLTMNYDNTGNAYKGVISSQSAGTTVIFKVYAKDNAGNWATSSLYRITFSEAPVEVDNPPTIDGISWSPERPKEGEDVYVFCQVNDDNGVSLAVLSYYNGTWYNSTMSYDATGSIYWDTIPSQPAGTTIIFKIYAKDNAGNWVISNLYRVTFSEAPVEVDNPPTIDSISWSPEQPIEDESVSIFCQVSDDKGISQVILSYYDGAWHNVTMAFNETIEAYTVTLPGLSANSTLIFKIYVFDSAGQFVISEIYTIYFRSAPQVQEAPSGIIGAEGVSAVIIISLFSLLAGMGIGITRKK